jgi:hypothetical protein
VAKHNPVRKFLAVKLVVFATYWQSLIVTTIPDVTKEEGAKWNDFILCIEMLGFAIVHLFAFSANEFSFGRRPDTKVYPPPLLSSFCSSSSPFDGVNDR